MNLESIIDTTRPLFRVAYSHETAQDFVQMVSAWKDEQSRPSLAVWKNELAEAKENYEQNKIFTEQLAVAEESVIRQISRTIQQKISYTKEFFDLHTVVKNKQAGCVGYSQLVYVLGNSVGLSVTPIDVWELVTGPLSNVIEGQQMVMAAHTASLVGLVNGNSVMVDLVPGGFVSKPFMLEKEFTKIGDYWELRSKDNPLGLHKTIRILNENGLIASIYDMRGCDRDALGQSAINDFSMSIKLAPKNAIAYFNRGGAYTKLKKYAEAISDYNSALDICPKITYSVYADRGISYARLGEHTKAIADFARAIQLCPEKDKTFHLLRAVFYSKFMPPQALSNLLRAVKIEPEYGPELRDLRDRAIKVESKCGPAPHDIPEHDPKNLYLLQLTCDRILKLSKK